MCLFERKENIRPIANKRLDIYERAVTYEGKEYNTRVLPVKGVLIPNKMQVIANSIAKHVSNVTFERVRPSRMILNFKLDSQDRLWLLWCSSIRSEGKALYMIEDYKRRLETVAHQNPLHIDTNVKLPVQIRPNFSIRHPLECERKHSCPSCNFAMEGDRLHEVSLKMIIDDHELRSIKDRKYLAKPEIFNPKDLVLRQEKLQDPTQDEEEVGMDDFIYQENDKAQPTFNETTESSEPKSMTKQFEGKLLHNPNKRKTALALPSRQSSKGLQLLAAKSSKSKVLF